MVEKNQILILIESVYGGSATAVKTYRVVIQDGSTPVEMLRGTYDECVAFRDNSKDIKTIYNLELHETMQINNDGVQLVVMRVASGWLYDVWDYTHQEHKTGVFVPFDNHFQNKGWNR